MNVLRIPSLPGSLVWDLSPCVYPLSAARWDFALRFGLWGRSQQRRLELLICVALSSAGHSHNGFEAIPITGSAIHLFLFILWHEERMR
jgi:hypothetical protein